MREKEQSLTILQTRKTQIEKGLAKIDVVSRTIGTSTFNRRFDLSGLQGEEFLDVAVRVGRVKEALEERARPTLQAQKEEIQRQIQSLQITEAKENLERIRRFVKKGFLTKDVLEKAEEEFTRIKTGITPVEVTPTTSARFERVEPTPVGQEVVAVGLAVKEEPEVKVKEKARLVFSQDQHRIELDGRKIGLTVKQFKVLRALAKSVGQPIPSRQLSRDAFGDGDTSRTYLRYYVERLKEKINPKEGDELLVSSGRRSRQSWYMLRGVEVVWPAKVLIEEVKRLKRYYRERESASLYQVTLPDGQQVEVWGTVRAIGLQILVDAYKEGKGVETDELAEILYGQYNKKTRNRVSLLMVVDLKRVLGQTDWQIIQPIGPQERSGGKMATYYLEKVRKEKKSEEVPPAPFPNIVEIAAPAPFSLEEAAILAAEMNTRSDILEKFGIPQVPKSIIDTLIRELKELKQPLQITEEELFEKRNQALNKLIEIVNNNLIDEVYDQQESEAVKDFLIHFLDLPKNYDLLKELLEIPLVTFHQEDGYGRVLKFWQELACVPETKPEEIIAEEVLPKVPRPEELAEKSQPQIVEEKPGKISEKPQKSQLSEEQERIFNEFMAEIKQHNLDFPITGATLTRYFPTLTQTFIAHAKEKNYIQPGQNRGGKEVYSQSDVLLLLYLKRGEKVNNLTPQKIKKIRREIENRLDERNHP